MAKKKQPYESPPSNPVHSASGLPDAVAAQYAIPKGRSLHFVCAEFGRVDLTTIDLRSAERLAQKGYLKKLDQTDP